MSMKRMITTGIIVVLMFVFTCILGAKAYSFAEKTAEQNQNRIDAAFSILEQK